MGPLTERESLCQQRLQPFNIGYLNYAPLVHHHRGLLHLFPPSVHDDQEACYLLFVSAVSLQSS
jgi:hypothetical protein